MSYRRQSTQDDIDAGPDVSRERIRGGPDDGGEEPADGFDGEWISLSVTDEGVALVELRAGAAYDWAFRSELRRVCRTTSEADPDAIVLTGEPGAFSITDGEEELDDAFGAKQELRATCDAVSTLGAPTVAAPRGDVRGYGLALALCADIRVGGEACEYGRAGVSPCQLQAGGVAKRLAATVGRDRAREFLTADATYDAESMAYWGLLNYVVSEDDVLDRAMDLAEDFADRPTDAYEHVKHAIRAATSVAGADVNDASGPDRIPASTADFV